MARIKRAISVTAQCPFSGSQRIRIVEMARAGILLNLVAVVLTLLAVYIFFPLVTGSQFGEFPEWGKAVGH